MSDFYDLITTTSLYLSRLDLKNRKTDRQKDRKTYLQKDKERKKERMKLKIKKNEKHKILLDRVRTESSGALGIKSTYILGR
jgi:hypothetical protein